MRSVLDPTAATTFALIVGKLICLKVRHALRSFEKTIGIYSDCYPEAAVRLGGTVEDGSGEKEQEGAKAAMRESTSKWLGQELGYTSEDLLDVENIKREVV
ncbi:hypothetical protein BC938DRAFT_476938 [Jimgerdemannia flammicorona]|uniref:Uncharacterized protein n=1 Tax=Jimgerdemannia flammicorona TaxID=994334 RepID=A0A433QPY7_9FUNG|nr:hypothetical protein BC938DRAFT_476938 [Jimgerdemannia flammicorona]